ncbi:MAG: class I SAM-dependent methyltransferase [Planctomycetota bacterium]
MDVTAAADTADIDWLLSEAAGPLLEDAMRAAEPPHTLAKRLRTAASPTRAALVMEQAGLRRRGAAKFDRACQMFFTRVGLEQATGEAIARYKARRFPAGQRVADVCCGIGGDLLSLAAAGPVAAVDTSTLCLRLAERNAEVAGGADKPRRVEVIAGAAERMPVEDFAAWHADPDRRPAGRRTTRPALHSPDDEALTRMLDRQPDAGIKLAPAAQQPAAWLGRCELEWISHAGECKQLVAWSGALAQRPGQRRATRIAPAGDANSLIGAPAPPPGAAPSIGDCVYEPDPAVFAAGLDGLLAAEQDLQPISADSGYLTGAAGRGSPLLAEFAVEEVLPARVKPLAAYLAGRGVGRIEVKQRGAGVAIPTLRQKLRLRGPHGATVLVTRRAKKLVAIVARRL